MKSISEIDKNFQSETFSDLEMKIYDTEQAPFQIHGLLKDEEGFYRIPKGVAEATSPGVKELNYHTAGGRIRFSTDSDFVALKAILPNIGMMPHMALTGSGGFDLYADGHFVNTFIPNFDYIACATAKEPVVLENIVRFPSKKMRNVTIHFPLYNGVSKVYIGLEKTAQVAEETEYAVKLPVVFYGSSITQGGCVSRPGNLYSAVLSRRLDCDFTCLGFSGNAKGEVAITNYIADLPMSVFVLDYDHNAPTVEHLENTHYNMYKTVRSKNPDLPIVMATRPSPCGDYEERIQVVKNTYLRAKQEGDKHVYFINGTDMFCAHDKDMMTVDGCHPNDFGSFCMAEKFYEVLKDILK